MDSQKELLEDFQEEYREDSPREVTEIVPKRFTERTFGIFPEETFGDLPEGIPGGNIVTNLENNSNSSVLDEIQQNLSVAIVEQSH